PISSLVAKLSTKSRKKNHTGGDSPHRRRRKEADGLLLPGASILGGVRSLREVIRTRLCQCQEAAAAADRKQAVSAPRVVNTCGQSLQTRFAIWQVARWANRAAPDGYEGWRPT